MFKLMGKKVHVFTISRSKFCLAESIYDDSILSRSMLNMAMGKSSKIEKFLRHSTEKTIKMPIFMPY